MVNPQVQLHIFIFLCVGPGAPSGHSQAAAVIWSCHLQVLVPHQATAKLLLSSGAAWWTLVLDWHRDTDYKVEWQWYCPTALSHCQAGWYLQTHRHTDTQTYCTDTDTDTLHSYDLALTQRPGRVTTSYYFFYHGPTLAGPWSWRRPGRQSSPQKICDDWFCVDFGIFSHFCGTNFCGRGSGLGSFLWEV